MLTGDNKEASQFMADKAGISEVYAQLKPTDKFEIMKTLRAKFGPVLYVGDGINDAPGPCRIRCRCGYGQWF